MGILPKPESIDMSGLKLSPSEMEFLFKLDGNELALELARYKEFYNTFDQNKIPKALLSELAKLEAVVAKLNK